MPIDLLFNAIPIPLGPDPMEVTIDAAQWVRERIKNGSRRLLVVVPDWNPPSPGAEHPDAVSLRAVLLPVENGCVWIRTATQAADITDMPIERLDAVFVLSDVPSSAGWRVGHIMGARDFPVWYQVHCAMNHESNSGVDCVACMAKRDRQLTPESATIACIFVLQRTRDPDQMYHDLCAVHRRWVNEAVWGTKNAEGG